MQVLQLIDSLRPGGAERMSVNYANALAKHIDASYLCSTRMEGLLKSQLSPEVGYLFLNKKSTLDLKAFLRLRKFVKDNKIDLIQAHSSSWFLALMVKLSLPRLKLVWHDHWGGRVFKKNSRILRMASGSFDSIFAVNSELFFYLKSNFRSQNVHYVKNFIGNFHEGKISLPVNENFKIIQVANLRNPKDHLTLLAAFKILIEKNYQVELHLVGKDRMDSYSNVIKRYVATHEMEKKVFFYGEQENVNPFLRGANLGVLSSTSEGLPLAVLEYAMVGLPVVCTDVGECREIIGENGFIVEPKNPSALAYAIVYYIKNPQKRSFHAKALQKFVKSEYSEKQVIEKVFRIFQNLLKVK